MKLHNTIRLMTGLALGTSAGSCALANDRYDKGPLTGRFKIRIGGFLIDRFDTTARFDSTQYPIGTLIDLEEDFNVDPSETVLRIDGFYRFNKRHRIDWTWYRNLRSCCSAHGQQPRSLRYRRLAGVSTQSFLKKTTRGTK